MTVVIEPLSCSSSCSLLGVLDHLSAVGGCAGGDFQAGHLAHSGACEAVHAVGTHLHTHTNLLSNTRLFTSPTAAPFLLRRKGVHHTCARMTTSIACNPLHSLHQPHPRCIILYPAVPWSKHVKTLSDGVMAARVFLSTFFFCRIMPTEQAKRNPVKQYNADGHCKRRTTSQHNTIMLMAW